MRTRGGRGCAGWTIASQRVPRVASSARHTRGVVLPTVLLASALLLPSRRLLPLPAHPLPPQVVLKAEHPILDAFKAFFEDDSIFKVRLLSLALVFGGWRRPRWSSVVILGGWRCPRWSSVVIFGGWR